MRAASLLAVLVCAKTITLVLLHRGVTLSAWSPVAYLWQDVAVVLLFFLLDVWLLRRSLAWLLYAAIAVYAAVNVPVTIVLSSPLTPALARAAGGALSDSIAHYVSPANLLAFALPLVTAVLVPVALARRRRALALRWPALAAAAILIGLGPLAITRVDTRGLHRNALGALVETSMPRLRPVPAVMDWRVSPFGTPPGEDLSRFRGTLAGRNVVLVILESTAARYLGIHGAREDPMPTLSALAANALVFERAYAVYPESIKGLFATLCSSYPAFDTEPETYAGVACTSLAERLRSAGYRTALFHSGRFQYLGMRSIIDNRGFDRLDDAGSIGGQVSSSFGIDERSTIRSLLAWIDARATRAPFFVTYQPIAGHHPYATTVPGPFSGSEDFPRYLNALHESDDALRLLVEGLRQRDLEKETLLVIVGDHGQAFGQHPGNYAHTLYIYDENMHVPLVVVAPGAIAGRTRVARSASVVDVAPTVLDLLGLAVPEAYQGGSLLDPASRMALFYTDYSLGWLGLIDGCWKYLFEMEGGRSRLFDVCADAGETEDLAGTAPGRVALYRARVQQWAAAQKARVQGDR